MLPRLTLALLFLLAGLASAQDTTAFVEVTSSRKEAYAGEVFEIRLRVGFDSRLVANLLQTSRQQLDLPVEVDAPWLRELPHAVRIDDSKPDSDRRATATLAVNGIRVEAARLDRKEGEPFMTVELATRFAVSVPGPLTVPGPTLRYSFATRFEEDLVNGRVPADRKDAVVRGANLEIRILPLPEEGRPPGFSGAVGQFTVRASVAARGIAEDQSLRLALAIEGSGNLQVFEPPRLEGIGSFRVQGILDSKGRGRRTITYDLVPSSDAVKEVPPIPFAFFDPAPPAQYRVIRTEPVPVSVPHGAESAPPKTSVSPAPARPTPGVNDLFGPKEAGLPAAERAYAAGRYAEAAERFRAGLEDPGAPKGALLYDLGNCAFRMERHAEAILAFRRAALELPRDEQVRFNLRFAEKQLGVEERPADTLATAIANAAGAFTNRELATLAAIILAAGIAGLVLGRSRAWRVTAVVILAGGLAIAALPAKALIWPGPLPAVVLADDLGLRDDPHAESAPRVRLGAGESVSVTESSDRWAHVRHARGSGWVERGSIGVVD